MTTIKRTWPVLLAGVLLVVGLVAWWMTVDLGSGDATDNAAIIDAKATAQVQASVTQTLSKVLTYDYADPTTTQAAADDLLAGKARQEYDTLFDSLKSRAPKQKLTLTAQVQAIGVKELSDDKAELLVFLDQSSQRAGDDESSVSAAQLAVTAQLQSGVWKVTGLKPL